MPYQPHTINGYAGLNEDENPAALGASDLREASNCCRFGNLTGTRPGLVRDTEYDADIAGGAAIQGIYEFRKGRDENRALVSVCGGIVHTSDTANKTKVGVQISAGAANLWTFASYQNLMWAAGGASGDSVWTWDGASTSVSVQLASLGLKPQFIFSKFNTIFLGGFLDGTDAWNNTLVGRYADYAEDATDVLSWPNSNSIPGQLLGENSGPGSYGAEYGTGFGSYQDNKGDFLLFLTNRRILSFLQNPNVSSNANRFIQSDAIANGCVSQRAFVDLGLDQSDAVYVSSSGVHSMALSQQYGNRENAFLSWPIRKTWNTINRSMLTRTCAAHWPEEGIVLIAVATGSATYLNTLLVMDIKGAAQISPDTVNWYKWNIGASVQTNMVSVARDPNGVPRIYIGGTAGEVAPFSRSAYADLGASYAVSFRGRDEDYGAPTVEKSFGDTFLMVGGSGDYSPTITYLADDGTKTIQSAPLTVPFPGFILNNVAGNLTGASTMDNAAGTLTSAGILGSDFNLVRDRVSGYGSGFNLSHKFTHAGTNEPFWIGQISQDVASQGKSDEASV